MAELGGASVLWDHMVLASVGGVGESAAYWEDQRSVAFVATCVGEGVQAASGGWDGADRVELPKVLAEKLGGFVGA